MIIIDIFEPQEIELLVAQSLPVSRIAINSQGYADYLWHDVFGLVNQVERKQVGELLSDIDRVEEQLGKEVLNADRTYLLYEGTFEPRPGLKTACQTYRKARDGKIMIPGRLYNTSYAGVQAWFDRLDKSGITVINTIDYVATAHTLVALYNNHQKKPENHTTFKRYIKPKIFATSKNPHVETLMGIKGASLGEGKAQELIDRYGSVWQVLNQDVEELIKTPGIGVVVARKLLKSVGRLV